MKRRIPDRVADSAHIQVVLVPFPTLDLVSLLFLGVQSSEHSVTEALLISIFHVDEVSGEDRFAEFVH